MYKELTIKNLKIFKEEQKLKIAPITLLYGENSSGKTTLLKTFDIIHNIFFERVPYSGFIWYLLWVVYLYFAFTGKLPSIF